ncbi:helix-turn-helix transcriptional regulator [Asticcacaulis sp. DXS10W]|uniref:Helix-turn-helix transcriptional regulator n=1 Tax=Asticcacaulis currens TaxID=2984210 RepID=A0ABT5IBG1_9CAUL|nr:helix-turn-helix transcriptional regulator [Asticcacaulis currens]MDC7693525.1 helix-turn-helix transcriptional regulator [Asticcacaulis currens]
MKKILRSPEQLALQELLKASRHSAQLTQESLAGKLGKPQSFVAKYEAGERLLNVIEFIYVVEALGKSPTEFMGELHQRIAGIQATENGK